MAWRQEGHRPPRPAPRRAAAAAVLGLAALTGCAVPSHQEPGQATAAVSDALSGARSATRTALLTVRLLDEGRVTGPVADTSLLDQLRALDDAERALTTLVPPDAASSEDRTTGLDAVGPATDAVVAAREWVAARAGGDLDGAPGLPPSDAALVADLEAATAQLDDALAEAGGP